MAILNEAPVGRVLQRVALCRFSVKFFEVQVHMLDFFLFFSFSFKPFVF